MSGEKQTSPTETGTGQPGPVRQFVGFVAWFSGSLAGLTAILYVFGFTAMLSSNRLLGVRLEFMTADPVFHVARGAAVITRSLFGLLWVALLVLAFLYGLSFVCRMAKRHAPSEGIWARVLDLTARAAPVLAVLLMFLGLQSGIGQIRGQPSSFVQALQVNEVTLKATDEFCAWVEPVQQAILSQNRTELDTAFAEVVTTAALVLSLGITVLPTAAREGLRVVLGMPTVLLCASALLSIPTAYGIYVIPTDRPKVLDVAVPGVAPIDFPARLLAQGTAGMLIWEEDMRNIVWLRPGSIDAMRIAGAGPIRDQSECGTP